MSRHGKHKALLGQVQHDIELGRIDTALFASNASANLLHQWQQAQLLTIREDGQAILNTSGRYWSPTLTRKLMMSLPPDEKENTMQKLSSEQQTVLRNSLAENPGQILEMLAGQHQCSFEDVINCLPAQLVKKTEGSTLSKSCRHWPAGTKPSPSSPTPPT